MEGAYISSYLEEMKRDAMPSSCRLALETSALWGGERESAYYVLYIHVSKPGAVLGGNLVKYFTV